jgi:phosphatidylglycerophosphatase A
LITTSPPDPKPAFTDGLAYFVATGAGAGLIPKAPGTFGSVEGVAVFLGIHAAMSGFSAGYSAGRTGFWILFTVANLLIFWVGVWASGRTARLLGVTDPGRVVIDEVSGQLISLTPVLFAPTWLTVMLGFVLFRAFDILKPYPIRNLERLPRGWGIMADDAGAGMLAAAVLLILRLARIV